MRKAFIVVGLVVMSVCAFAEKAEPSLFDKICSVFSSSSGEVVADAEALKDKSIASLNQQIKDLKAKYEAVRSSSSEEAEEFKKKYEELKAELKRKYEEFKAEQKKKYEEAKAKRKAEQQSDTNETGFVQGVFNLFK